MDVGRFFRGDLERDPAAGLQALMRAVLIRTQFLPTVRHRIGWRGLKQASFGVEAWTAKIRDAAGVFGLFFMGLEPSPGWAVGRFGLCYFPDPEEPLVERCSLAAAAATQAEGYRVRLRDFPNYPGTAGLFGIGSLLLSVRRDQRALALALEAVSVQRTVAADGVRVEREGQAATLVAPGGADQDFPAFETALGFFDVLAASVTFNLEQPPVRLIERRHPATQLVYDRSGRAEAQEAPDLWHGILLVVWGEGAAETLLGASGEAGAERRSSLAAADGPETAPPDYRERLWWRAHRLADSRSIDKKLLGVDGRPPFILLTGFLGAGKTSFLQHYLEYQTQRSRFVAVIQNEIGAQGLDGKLLGYTVAELDEGCVCCSLAGNLGRAVSGILERFTPDSVILETSGLANPFNLYEELEALSERLRLDATVTVVDAVNLEEALAQGPIAADQIRAADILVINKCDLVDEERASAVEHRLFELNPAALRFRTVGGELNPALLFDVEVAPPGNARRKGAVPTVPAGQPRHRPSFAAAGLWSRSLSLSRPLDRDRFFQAVARLSPAVFRAKGILDFAGEEGAMVFQYVNGRFELSRFGRAEIAERFLTLIGGAGATDPEAALAAVAATLFPEDVFPPGGAAGAKAAR
ncbi:MAG: GTP-binding protein [Deltaproteobacteria bacterium]|nr:GTP-binding protein [Deltaproteobacteria bacterium]